MLALFIIRKYYLKTIELKTREEYSSILASFRKFKNLYYEMKRERDKTGSIIDESEQEVYNRYEQIIEDHNRICQVSPRCTSNSNPKIKLHNISFHIYILFGLASNKYIFQHFIKAFKIKHCC